MSNILLIGNGFDLAHGLPTSYNQFLTVMKFWNQIMSAISIAKSGRKVDENNLFKNFTINASNFDMENLKRLGDIVQRNSWVHYFCKCEAEIDKWIDFEKEIYPVIELFEFVFNSNYHTAGHGGSFGEAHIEKGIFSPKLLRVARLWEKYINTSSGSSVFIKEPYATVQYGILKKKIMEDLRKEFDEFILAFEIYLYEFVYKNKETKILKQIKDLDIGSVISFNYTLTEQLYGIDEKNTHHIHGRIRDDLSIGKNNMVVGVNEQINQNMEFIYFVKYFQRIQNASGVKYKDFIRSKVKNNSGIVAKEKYNLYIYGHSLDETDEDILKYVIGNKTEKGRLNLNPKQIIIFYYDASDYEQKVINLIKLYGRAIVEEYMEKEMFKFIPTCGDVV